MKFSYSILKKYLPHLPNPETLLEDLQRHVVAGVSLHHTSPHLRDVFVGKVITCRDHPNSDKLHVCTVELPQQHLQIVCGAPNVKAGILVPVAVVGACLGGDFVIQKTILRGEKSEGMICSLDELGLVETRQEGIYILPDDVPLGMNMADYLGKNDVIIEIEEADLSGRHDLHSYRGLLRELSWWYSGSVPHLPKPFTPELPHLDAENMIPEAVPRYMLLKIDGVQNHETPQDLQHFLEASGYKSRGFLVDLSNACLAWLGQPNHIFDAHKIIGKVVVRFAYDGESFHGLDDQHYQLTHREIVIADDEKVLALGGIMGSMTSCVTPETKHILIESATFSPTYLLATCQRLKIETPSALSFLAGAPMALSSVALSYLSHEISQYFPNSTLTGFFDSNPSAPLTHTIPFEEEKLASLLGGSMDSLDRVFEGIGIDADKDISGYSLKIPLYRMDIKTTEDLASEYVRLMDINIVGLVPSRLPNLICGTPELRVSSAKFLAENGFLEVLPNGNDEVVDQLLGIKKKNPLSNDFFTYSWKEKELWLSVVNLEPTTYYEMQTVLIKLLEALNIGAYSFVQESDTPLYAHSTQTANLIVRGKKSGRVGTFSHFYREEKGIKGAFIEISLTLLSQAIPSTPKEKKENLLPHKSFDLSILSDKKGKGSELQKLLLTADACIAQVDLFDLYENEEKLPGKRSLSYHILYRVDAQEVKIEDLKSKILEKISKKGFSYR